MVFPGQDPVCGCSVIGGARRFCAAVLIALIPVPLRSASVQELALPDEHVHGVDHCVGRGIEIKTVVEIQVEIPEQPRRRYCVDTPYFTTMANEILHKPPVFNPTTQVVS